MRRLASIVLTLLMLANIPAFAQSTKGSLSGLVSDSNGAAVTGAKVTLKNIATGEETKADTNSQGAFSFPQLQPGKYTATVEASGFKKAEVTEITVEVAQSAKVDIGLEVGAMSEQVTVTGEAQEIINS